MADVFGTVDNTLGLTQLANAFETKSFCVYLGYIIDHSTNKIALGPTYSPSITNYSPTVKSTNNKAATYNLTNINQVTYPFGLNSTVIGRGSDDATGTTRYLFSNYEEELVHYPLGLNASVSGQGSEQNTLQQLPIVYIGPFEEPSQSWIGSLGYYTFISTNIYRTLNQSLTLSQSEINQLIHTQSLSHTLIITDLATGLDLNNTFNTLSVNDSVTTLLVHIQSLTNTLSLTDLVTAEGLATGTSTLLITDNIDYSTDHLRAFLDNLSITDSVNYFIIHTQSLSHILSITDSIIPLNIHNQSLSHSLSTTDNVTANRIYNAANTINLTQDLLRSVIYNRSLSNTLTLGHSAISSQITISVVDNLNLTQSIIYFPHHTYYESISNNLSLSDILMTPSAAATHSDLNLSDNVEVHGPIYISIEQTIYPFDNVTTLDTIHSYDLNDDLGLSDEVRRVLPQQDLTQSLSLTQSIVQSKAFEHNLILMDTFNYILSKSFNHNLNISHNLIVNMIKYDTFSHNLTLGQSVVYIKNTPDLCYYRPQSSVLPNTIPAYSQQTQIVLTYPYNSPSLTLNLRCPGLEDTQRDSFNRIIRESRGGNQFVYRDQQWPKNKTLTYEVSFNKWQQVEDFYTFMQQCLGRQIGLLDYLNRQWRGLIITPDNLFTQVSKTNRKLTFNFEGELV